MQKFSTMRQPVLSLQAKYSLQGEDHQTIAICLVPDNQIFYKRRKVWPIVGNNILVYI